MVPAALPPISRRSAHLAAAALLVALSFGAANADVGVAGADEGLIYYLTPESAHLFETASDRDRSDFWPLSARFVSEIRETFCGVASSVMVLNALGITPPVEPEWYPN